VLSLALMATLRASSAAFNSLSADYLREMASSLAAINFLSFSAFFLAIALVAAAISALFFDAMAALAALALAATAAAAYCFLIIKSLAAYSFAILAAWALTRLASAFAFLAAAAFFAFATAAS